MTFFHSLRSLLASLLVSVLLGGCIGGGNTAPPPSTISVVPGDGQVTVSWTGDPNVQYWIIYAPGTAISTSGTSFPAGYNWKQNVTSPFVITGLVNGTTYAFAMNGRTNDGPGGESSVSVSATPRTAGGYWNAGASLGSTTLTGQAYGLASDATTDYLAVGTGNAMFKSLDAITWTAITPAPSSGDFTAAVYAFSNFLAADSTGVIYRSTDLVTWAPSIVGSTAGSITGGTSINAIAPGIASGVAVTVAVGNGGKIFTSIDGVTWTAATSSGLATTQNLYGVSYSPSGTWFAVGANGTILTSADASTWTATPSGTSADLRAVAAQIEPSGSAYTYSYVAVGLGGTILQSNDGQTWTAVSSGSGIDFYAIAASTVQFLAVGSGGAAYASTNGTAWAQTTPSGGGISGALQSTSATTQTLYSLIYQTFQYVAVGAAGTNITSQ